MDIDKQIAKDIVVALISRFPNDVDIEKDAAKIGKAYQTIYNSIKIPPESSGPRPVESSHR